MERGREGRGEREREGREGGGGEHLIIEYF